MNGLPVEVAAAVNAAMDALGCGDTQDEAWQEAIRAFAASGVRVAGPADGGHAPPEPSPDAIEAVSITKLTEYEAGQAAAVFFELNKREDPYALTRTIEHIIKMRQTDLNEARAQRDALREAGDDMAMVLDTLAMRRELLPMPNPTSRVSSRRPRRPDPKETAP